MNDYNLIFAIIVALASSAISFGVSKNQINVNTSNILDLQKVVSLMSDLKSNIELNKKDVDSLKEYNFSNMDKIENIQEIQNKTNITLAQILEKLDNISKKLS